MTTDEIIEERSGKCRSLTTCYCGELTLAGWQVPTKLL